MDFLLVHQHSISQIQLFLAEVFDCLSERIRIFSVEEINSLNEELDDSSLDCVCILSSVRGDASQLLQLYRYKIGGPDALTRIVDIALKNRISCYVPSNSLDGWIYVSDDFAQRRVHQITCDEEDCFLFELI